MEMLSHSGKACASLGAKPARAEARQGSQQGGGLGQVLAQLVQQHVGAPEEHAGVPVEIAGRHVAPGLRQRPASRGTAAPAMGFGAGLRAPRGNSM